MIPKSPHILNECRENLNVFDFALSAGYGKNLLTGHENECFLFPYDPAMVEWFANMVERTQKEP